MDVQPRADLRGLKVLVGGLGVLVVLGTALVIGVIIHRLYAKPPAPSIIAAPAMIPGAPAPSPEIANRLPPGESIKSIAAAGPDVAIWVSGPSGDRVLLINPTTGKVTVAILAAP